MTNWQAMQAAGAAKKAAHTQGCRTRYMSMGSWHASLSKGGIAVPAQGRKPKNNTSIMKGDK